MIRALAVLALALALAACGQKGPLRLPEPSKADSPAFP
jgi:predicted small lipoprotein YifL